MGRSRQMGAPKRTTRIPIRGEKLEAADRLLAAAKEQRILYDGLTVERSAMPLWKPRLRRRNKALRFQALVRYMQAITAAQDLANGRGQ